MSAEGALIVFLLACILGWMLGGWIGLAIAVVACIFISG
jgi:chromate transport protein ChrA